MILFRQLIFQLAASVLIEVNVKVIPLDACMYVDTEGSERCSSNPIETSALEGVSGQLHAPAALPRKRQSSHCTGGWVDLGAGLAGRGISRPY
jgi:hypothetical protein